MPSLVSRALTAAAIWVVAAALLWWSRLPGVWRRALALLTSGAGLVFLILAIRTEGVRESPTMAVFLLGTPYVTQQASASASLPYYVLTAVCLLLGTGGLALRDEVVQKLSRHWMATAVVLSLAVTALRFCLEKAAAPRFLTWAVGVTWLAPVVGAFFFLNLREEGKGLWALVGRLLGYGILVRGFVAALYLAASTLGLGSHYDVSSVLRVESPFTRRIYEFEPGSLEPVVQLGVLPQLLFWPLYTLVSGLVGAGVAGLLTWSGRSSRVPSVRAEVALPAVEPDR